MLVVFMYKRTDFFFQMEWKNGQDMINYHMTLTFL